MIYRKAAPVLLGTPSPARAYPKGSSHDRAGRRRARPGKENLTMAYDEIREALSAARLWVAVSTCTVYSTYEGKANHEYRIIITRDR